MSLSQSDMARAPFVWTRGMAAREVLNYLERQRIDATPILSSAGLSRTQVTQDPSDVPAAAQHRFLELAATTVNDPLLGLHVAAAMDIRNIGLLYYLAAACATVADALEDLKRYAATTTDEIQLEIAPHEQETIVTFRRAAAFDELPRQHAELVALAFIRVLSHLTGRHFAPSRIGFAHGRNSGMREVHRILRCPVEFAQAADFWVLPASVVRLPVISEDQRLLHILEAHADDLLAKKHPAMGWRGMVENQLLSVLPSGSLQAGVIADHLGMSVRTLRRHLAQEDTSFAAVLDELRQRLAFRYLQDEQVTLQQIAWLLGYSEVGAFNHAFKRWTGTSPGRARASRLYQPLS